MQRFIIACLTLIASPHLFAIEPIRVHWPLTEYVSLVKTEAKDLMVKNGTQVGLSFPTLILFSKTGELAWIGKPVELTPEIVEATNNSGAPAETDALSKVLSVLDNARKVYQVVGFEQVSGAPSAHVSRNKATAILVVGNFSCEGCVSMIETSMQAIPNSWNQMAATVTVSQ